MSYRDTATALAQRVPESFVGVVLYVELPHAGLSARWDMQVFPRGAALEEWYEEIAGSPTLYYYIAAFDKTRDTVPVGESTAPPKPGQPGFDIRSTWRHAPYRRPAVAGLVGAERREKYTEPTWYPIALIGAMFGVAYVATSRAVTKIKRRRGEAIASGR